jgi:hypothetical protein
MKKVHTFNADDKIYKEFKIYAIKKGKSVSELLNEYMKKCLKEK